MASWRNTKYNVVKSYNTYKDKLNFYKANESQVFIGDCDNFNTKYSTYSNYDILETCKTTMRFLNHSEEQNNSYVDEGCKYLFYWIYTEALKREIHIDTAFNIYEMLLQTYDDENDSYTLQEYIKNINKDMLFNLIKLIGLYENFNKLKEVSKPACKNCDCAKECVKWYTGYVEECHAGYDTDFCDELENFRDLYNEHMLSENDCVGVEKILPSTRRVGLAFAISIPLVTLLMMSFIFFILYKFTSFGSLLDKMVKKKHIWNDIENDTYKMIHDTGMISHNSENSSYLISYNTSLNS
ncbi:PIR protein [Plasmodium ovale]|uniref:PIR protein n=1 Tax=Plasmodium ovale TaxID=36330 RepID=A0A1C3KI94_PLAOA|nr:PIR protein [Plasmodium ovale]